MKKSLINNDFITLKREAHSIKSGAATVEAKPLSEIAGRLEEDCINNKIDNIENDLNILITEYNRLKNYIDKEEQE